MHLTVLTASLSRNAGGLFTSVRKLTQGLAALGVDATVFGFEDEHTCVDRGKWDPIDTQVFPGKGLRSFPVSMRLLKAVLESSPDILHSHGIWQFPSLIDLMAGRRLGIPYVISPRGMLDPWAVRNSAARKKLAGLVFENCHLRRARCIHALCESEAGAIRAYSLTNPIAVIPNGVDLPDRGSGIERPRTDRRRLAFLGRLHPKKGLIQALCGWEIATRDNPAAVAWQFVIAGWEQGGHRGELERLCRDRGIPFVCLNIHDFLAEARMGGGEPRPLPPGVAFVGSAFGADKDSLLRNAHAFILPSLSEGLPMSVLEAWASQLPVLMTDHCNLPEGFACGAAERVEPMSTSIAEGMRRLFSMSDDDRTTMGKKGRLLVQRQFTWPMVAGRMQEVYNWILGGGDPPDGIALK